VVRQFALSKFFQQIHQIRNLRPLIQGSKVNLRRNKSEPRMAEMGQQQPHEAVDFVSAFDLNSDRVVRR
jgi:hypothetical protein